MVSGEILRVVANYSVPGASAVQNVFWYQLLGDDISDAATLTLFDTWFTGTWGDQWAVVAEETCSLETIDLDVINTNGTVKRNIGQATIAVSGDVTVSDQVTAAVSGYIKANTALPKTRGSKYVPGFSEGGTADGLWTSTVTDVLLALLLLYLDAVENNGSSFVPGVLRRVAMAWQDFNNSGDITDVPAYQRRRKPNVGA